MSDLSEQREPHDARPEQSAGVTDLIGAAFGEHDAAAGVLVSSVWQALVHSDHLRASLVVDDGDLTVGHVGLSRAWLDARHELVEVMVLSPLSTRPGHQGRGIGAALIAAAVARADDLGAPALFLEGDPAYYGRHGFVAGAEHGFEAPSRRIPEAAFQVRPLSSHDPRTTGRLIYPELWWRHDAVGLRDPLLGELGA